MLVQAGYIWTVTFATAVGNLPQMIPTDELTGINHNVTVRTIRDGNTIQGTFRIGFLGGTTRRIPVTATEEELEDILQVVRTIIDVVACLCASARDTSGQRDFARPLTVAVRLA